MHASFKYFGSVTYTNTVLFIMAIILVYAMVVIYMLLHSRIYDNKPVANLKLLLTL